MTTSKHTAAAQLRREVEARTGTTANMAALGYKPTNYSLAGEPTRFCQSVVPQRVGRASGEGIFHLVRTHGKRWRVEQDTGRKFYPKNEWRSVAIPVYRKVSSPLFPGPVAAAIWLAVEIENGSVRFDESKGSAGSAGTVLRNDPA